MNTTRIKKQFLACIIALGIFALVPIGLFIAAFIVYLVKELGHPIYLVAGIVSIIFFFLARDIYRNL